MAVSPAVPYPVRLWPDHSSGMLKLCGREGQEPAFLANAPSDSDAVVPVRGAQLEKLPGVVILCLCDLFVTLGGGSKTERTLRLA